MGRGVHPILENVTQIAVRFLPTLLFFACDMSVDDDDELMLNVLRCHLTY